MNILLLAPPAAGKGTQADLLQKKYGVVAISTGQLLREAAKKNDMLGLKLKEVLKTGQLVEDGIVLELLQNRFSELQGSSFLLDGFPRNIRQAELLDKLLVNTNQKLDYVFFLDVPKEELEARIISRRTCEDCGKVYSVSTHSLDTCSCGGKLIIRSDDNLEAFQKRYDEYVMFTESLVPYYEERGILYRINANRPSEEVFSDIEKILESGIND